MLNPALTGRPFEPAELTSKVDLVPLWNVMLFIYAGYRARTSASRGSLRHTEARSLTALRPQPKIATQWPMLTH